MMDQLSLLPRSVDEIIESRAAQALVECQLAAREAREFINRSCGQHLRRSRERVIQQRGELNWPTN